VGNYVVNQTEHENNYIGDEDIKALYFMLTYNILPKLKVVGGLRWEQTYMFSTIKSDTSSFLVAPLSMYSEERIAEDFTGEIDVNDFLPALNLIYSINDDINFRLSGSRTIARPNLRELAPFATTDFIGGVVFNGNPELKRTKIQNYDLRWEWFVRPGELLAVSTYYKHFENPIIRQYLIEVVNPQIRFQNTESGQLFGFELEARKNLDFISASMRDFNLGFNFSLIDSKVDVDLFEQETAELNGWEVKETRPFPGQSPYLVNLNLSYANTDLGLNATLDFNKFGDRMTETNIDTPDIYESSDGMLNFTGSKTFMKNFTFGFKVRNLLNSKFKKSVTYKDLDYVYQEYQLGRTFTVSLGYKIN
jgi:TonB-dependent receptor